MSNLYKQLNPTRPLPGNIKDLISKFKSISNPQAMIEKYANENPQIKSVIQAANGNPELAFRNLAKQMNIDPDEIIKLLW